MKVLLSLLALETSGYRCLRQTSKQVSEERPNQRGTLASRANSREAHKNCRSHLSYPTHIETLRLPAASRAILLRDSLNHRRDNGGKFSNLAGQTRCRVCSSEKQVFCRFRTSPIAYMP